MYVARHSSDKEKVERENVLLQQQNTELNNRLQEIVIKITQYGYEREAEESNVIVLLLL